MVFLFTLFTLYICILAAIFVATILLIALDFTWGPIPHMFVRFLEKIYDLFQEAYPDGYFEQMPWKNLLEEKKPVFNCNDSLSDFELIEMHPRFPFQTHLNLTRSGIEAIIQDEFSNVFSLAHDYQKYELNRKLWRFLKNKVYLRVLFALLILLRVLFIFPVRSALYISSFVFISWCCVLTYFITFTTEQKLFITRRYCRLYTAGTGLIAFFYNEKDKPRPPGVIVANHLTANDLMVIASDVSPGQNFLYTVTGQQHSGVIGAIQALASKIGSTMWLERSIADSRLKFLKEVLASATQERLVVMFPEGYCSNNSVVLQFRKAVFEKDVKIHPVAIRQDARFGDAFWKEDWFICYLLRVLSSFFTIYHVYYLPVQHRYEDETSEKFAERVQQLIGKISGARPLQFQGTLFYKSCDRQKYREHIRKICTKDLCRSIDAPSSSATSTSD